MNTIKVIAIAFCQSQNDKKVYFSKTYINEATILEKLKTVGNRALRPYLSETVYFEITKNWRVRPKNEYVYALILKHLPQDYLD